MLTGVPDLDDVAALLDADVEGLLPASALAGAQCRAVASARGEGVLEPLAHLRPRAVVLVCGDGPAGRAADLVLALVTAHIDVPVIRSDTVPSWIGPLDVVVIAGDDAGSPRLADAAARAGRRQAEVVVAGPVEGPLRDALAGRVLNLSPRVPVPARFRFTHYVCAFLAVLDGLKSVRVTGRHPDLDELADRLDTEAARNHPANEMFHNAAKELAARLVGHPTVWAADTPAAVALAVHASRSVFASAGIVSTATELGEVLAAVPVLARSGGALSPDYDPIFHDAQIDGPVARRPVRVQVLTTPDREWQTRRLIGALPDADVLTSGPESSSEARQPTAGDRGFDGPPVPGLDDVVPLMILALRVDMAGAYLRLVGEH
jgi:hypothetical protein